VAYSDFQCPYCIRDYPILKKYIEQSNGAVNMTIRHFPLDMHAQAKSMANASECVAEQTGDAGFWQFADTVFVSGKFDYSSDAFLQPVVAKFNLNGAKYSECMKTLKFQPKIDAYYSEGKAVGVVGTPSMVLYNSSTKRAAFRQGVAQSDDLDTLVKNLR
jgi:protein-disulfide isomerase